MTKKSPKDRFSTLTEREKDVLRMVCDHKSYQEIADELFIGKTTVKTHMHNIYVKLGLDDLNRDERILTIHNTYSAFFTDEKPMDARSQENAIIEIWPDPEPLSPDEEELVDGDEMALIAFTPPTITAKGKKKMKKTGKKKRGCFKYMLVLLLGAALTIGAWQAWLYLIQNPLVVSIVELINPDLISAAQAGEPSLAKPTVKPQTAPTAKSVSQSGGAVVTYHATPTAKSGLQTAGAVVVENNTDDIFELNEWYSKDGVWLRLVDYDVRVRYVYFNFEIWNKTGQEIYFSWKPQDHFSLTDNKNNRYEIAETYDQKVIVANDERLHFTGQGYNTIQFKNDPIFESGVTDLYVTMEYLSKLDKAVFHVSLGK